ncbi:MAG: hypothetical protein M3503_02765 [Actinomycetota bacterium]|nr:hypothetical protein [Actinomycetota bacterium]
MRAAAACPPASDRCLLVERQPPRWDGLRAQAGTWLVRLTLLRVALDAPQAVEGPPGLLLVGSDGAMAVASEAAASWLEAIDDRSRIPSALRAALGISPAHGAGPR